MTSDRRQSAVYGTRSEELLGFSRAVRHGEVICVSGTTADLSGVDPADDNAGSQARQILTRIQLLLEELGADFENVIRSRIYLTNMDDLSAVAEAHAESFGGVRPATTVVQVAALAAPRLLVEMEVDAWCSKR